MHAHFTVTEKLPFRSRPANPTSSLRTKYGPESSNKHASKTSPDGQRTVTSWDVVIASVDKSQWLVQYVPKLALPL